MFFYLDFLIVITAFLSVLSLVLSLFAYGAYRRTFWEKLKRADFSNVVFRPDYAADEKDFLFKVKASIYKNEYQGTIIPIYRKDSLVVEKIVFMSGHSGQYLDDVTMPNNEESAKKIKAELDRVCVILGLRKGYYRDHCGHPAFRRDSSWVVFVDTNSTERWGVVSGLKSVALMDQYATEKNWKWVSDETEDMLWDVVAEIELRR